MKALLLTFLLALNVYADGIEQNCPVPSDIKVNAKYDIVCHDDWTSYMDSERKIPRMVFYSLTADKVLAKPLPRHNNFAIDPTFNKPQATPDDYKNSGYDRGHLYANSDADYTPASAVKSFYMTNTAPQTHTLNAGPWLQFEQKSRSLALKHGSVRVYAISVYSDHSKRIGSNVTVPDAFIKVICTSRCTTVLFPNNESKKYSYIHPSVFKQLTNKSLELK